jgi:hypothetical protein
MPQLAIVLGLVLIPVLLLMILLWWRFYGGGKDSLRTTGTTKFGNYRSLRTYRYEVRDFVPEIPAAGPNPLPGNILDELVSEEQYEEQYLAAQKAATTPVGAHTNGETSMADSGKSPDPASVLTGMVEAERDEDTLVSGPITSSDAFPEIDQETSPAQSLYDNPLTAPAPTDNDKRNRQAEIELKKRQRAALKTNSQSAQYVLSELFSPDSPARTPIVKAGSDEK